MTIEATVNMWGDSGKRDGRRPWRDPRGGLWQWYGVFGVGMKSGAPRVPDTLFLVITLAAPTIWEGHSFMPTPSEGERKGQKSNAES